MLSTFICLLLQVFDRFAPAFKGLGYAMLSYRFFVNVYYVVITAWALFFLFAGFTSDLPWGNCVDQGADWWASHLTYMYAHLANRRETFFLNFVGTLTTAGLKICKTIVTTKQT